MQARHLELLSAPALAAELGISTFTLRKRRDLPPPVKLGNKLYWFRSELAGVLPPPRHYSDDVGPEGLATLLAVSPNQVYRMVRQDALPKPATIPGPRGRRGCPMRSRWSRKDVEGFLRALPRA